MATIHTRHVEYEASLSFYKKAHEVSGKLEELTPEDIKWLHLGIAFCYTYLEFPFKAISFLENTRDLHTNKRASVLNLHFGNELIKNYIRVNDLLKAEKLLEHNLIYANSMKDDLYIGLALHNFGRLRKQSEKWEEASNYLDQTVKCFEKGSMLYLWAMHDAVCC